MIPFVIFITLMAIGVILFLYFMMDNKNRIYGNIVAAFLCSLVFGYLAMVSMAPVVVTTPVINTTSTTTVNGTTTTAFVYDTPTATSSSEGYIFLMISAIVMVYTLFMIYEVYGEYKKGTEEAEDW